MLSKCVHQNTLFLLYNYRLLLLLFWYKLFFFVQLFFNYYYEREFELKLKEKYFSTFVDNH